MRCDARHAVQAEDGNERMIYCSRNALQQYRGLHPNLDRALDALQTMALEALPDGKTTVDGDRVCISRSHYETGERAETLFETHLHYADIHLLLMGAESIAVAEVTEQAEVKRDEANDYVGTRGDSQCICHLKPGMALVVFPGEAHRPGQAYGESCIVHKLVIKVLMDGHAQ